MTAAPVPDVSDPLEARLTLPRKVQAFLVNAIKSHAIAVLHSTVRGEALLLRIYLWAEEGAEKTENTERAEQRIEGAVLGDVIAADLPGWLADQIARHAQDEERHATLLRRRLAEMGADARRVDIDPLSRWKLRAIEKVALASAAGFRAGRAVPLFAVAHRMEAMGVRVLERHLRALARIEARRQVDVPARELLREIAADERRHVELCARALRALVHGDEAPLLGDLLRRIDAIERAFGICSAIGLVAAGYGFKIAAAAARWSRPGQRERRRTPTAAGS